jgi:hypothetical protein
MLCSVNGQSSAAIMPAEPAAANIVERTPPEPSAHSPTSEGAVAHSCETSVVLAGCLKLHTWIQAIRNLAAISTYAYVDRRTRGVPTACDSHAL